MYKYTDKSGVEIKVGDYIVYSTLLGRSASLKFGKVLELRDKGTMRVQGADSRWYSKGKWELSGKGIVSYPERTLVIPFTILPREVQDLLVCVC